MKKKGANTPLRGNVVTSRFHESGADFLTLGGTLSQKEDYAVTPAEISSISSQGIDIVFSINLKRPVQFAVDQANMILNTQSFGRMIAMRLGNEEGNLSKLNSISNPYPHGQTMGAEYKNKLMPYVNALKDLKIPFIFTGALPSNQIGDKYNQFRMGFNDYMHANLPSNFDVDFHVYRDPNKPKITLDYITTYKNMWNRRIWIIECGVKMNNIQNAGSHPVDVQTAIEQLISLTPEVWQDTYDALGPNDMFSVQLMSNPVIGHGLLESPFLLEAFKNLGKVEHVDTVKAITFRWFGWYKYIIDGQHGEYSTDFTRTKLAVGDMWAINH